LEEAIRRSPQQCGAEKQQECKAANEKPFMVVHVRDHNVVETGDAAREGWFGFLVFAYFLIPAGALWFGRDREFIGWCLSSALLFLLGSLIARLAVQ